MKRAAGQSTLTFMKKPKPAAETPKAAGPVHFQSKAEPPEPSKWNKQEWINSLSRENHDLLRDEIENIDESWLCELHKELTKPYFLQLKKYLNSRYAAGKKVYPPVNSIYSWSKLCKLKDIKVIVLGQDPYHRPNQAHGLAFSVNPPTSPPPSLLNMFKELETCEPGFKRPQSGSLIPWAEQGVLLLNTCLTVEEGQPNSHANKGWEQFTQEVLKLVAKNDVLVLMAWGSPAQKRIGLINPNPKHLVLKSVHPSPLSASRGWFGTKHFSKANDFLKENGKPAIDWNLA